MAEALESGELRVYYAFTSNLGETERGRCQGLLSEEELARHARFRFEADRDSYLVAHALTRTMLADALGIGASDLRFEQGNNGRPELAQPITSPRLRFNLSHTRGLVACGLALELDIGVDVEHVDRKVEIDTLGKRVFSESERHGLDALTGDTQRRRFFELWTLKEAYLKATGEGISRSLQEISIGVPAGAKPTIVFSPQIGDNGERWLLHLQQVADRFALAVAAAPSTSLTRCEVREWLPWT